MIDASEHQRHFPERNIVSALVTALASANIWNSSQVVTYIAKFATDAADAAADKKPALPPPIEIDWRAAAGSKWAARRRRRKLVGADLYMGRAEGMRRGKGDGCFGRGQRRSSHPFWYGLLRPWVVLSRDVVLETSVSISRALDTDY